MFLWVTYIRIYTYMIRSEDWFYFKTHLLKKLFVTIILYYFDIQTFYDAIDLGASFLNTLLLKFQLLFFFLDLVCLSNALNRGRATFGMNRPVRPE